MKIEIIAAVSNGFVIGKGNQLPWSLPADLERFRSVTYGHAVIMGRKTWEGLGRPLTGRQNIVVSRSLKSEQLPLEVGLESSVKYALKRVEMPSPAFAIGGTEVYREALRFAERMHLTEIHSVFDGDVYFPTFDKNEWSEVERLRFDALSSVPFNYDFVEYLRIEQMRFE